MDETRNGIDVTDVNVYCWVTGDWHFTLHFLNAVDGLRNVILMYTATLRNKEMLYQFSGEGPDLDQIICQLM